MLQVWEVGKMISSSNIYGCDDGHDNNSMLPQPSAFYIQNGINLAMKCSFSFTDTLCENELPLG